MGAGEYLPKMATGELLVRLDNIAAKMAAKLKNWSAPPPYWSKYCSLRSTTRLCLNLSYLQSCVLRRKDDGILSIEITVNWNECINAMTLQIEGQYMSWLFWVVFHRELVRFVLMRFENFNFFGPSRHASSLLTPASNRVREILKSRKSVREIAIIIHLLLNELKAHCPADIWLGHLGMLIPVGIQEKLWRLQSYNHNHQQYTCGGDLICPIFPSYSWLQGLFCALPFVYCFLPVL